ncbi:MAG: hypothetical protein HeimC3_47120 [Candidatus Heimdallarchaeota archaeon LC_3]|nr:MAG: hypothetical protein HeimC3_47120 [Candidatus Heimdallarchaeota archaeon LC_3]
MFFLEVSKMQGNYILEIVGLLIFIAILFTIAIVVDTLNQIKKEVVEIKKLLLLTTAKSQGLNGADEKLDEFLAKKWREKLDDSEWNTLVKKEE